ncbi:type II toxin-antitoxin system HigB family toxin, partial [Acinetobacter junii]|uniref:type II toxin-antitoxin system HigB family toxin n=1 Tax=Acinetobacter junii TaxID=40215 RepID=UPI0024B6A9DE
IHVYDIGWNKIRLIAVVMYQAKRVYIRHVLSHKEYDKCLNRTGFVGESIF